MAQPMTTAAGNNKASWMRLSIRTNDCSGPSLDEDFAGGDGRSGWSEGITIGASYTPRVGTVGFPPARNRGVPHISLVFREMWDTTDVDR
jgi:hypothetical protein